LRIWQSTGATVLCQILKTGGDPRSRYLVRHDHVPLVRVTCETPVALQLDGDHLGERSDVEFLSVPAALRVVV
jgi:diacylglycerol kinase family enzyme